MEDLETKPPFRSFHCTIRSTVTSPVQGRRKTRNMPKSYPRSTWKRWRGMQARLGGTRQKATHLQKNLLMPLSLVLYQSRPRQSLVKKTNTFITSSSFLRSKHLTHPMLFPDTALPTDFYDSVYINTCPSCTVAISAQAVLNNQSSKYL